jgi:hypothetical protein
MAKSEGDGSRIPLPLDDDDKKFIVDFCKPVDPQASFDDIVNKRVKVKNGSPTIALKLRYTDLLKNIKSDGPAVFHFGKNNSSQVENTGYTKLVEKLKVLGLNNASVNGLELTHPDVINWLDRGVLSVNYKQSKVASQAGKALDAQMKSARAGDSLPRYMDKIRDSYVDTPGYEDVYDFIRDEINNGHLSIDPAVLDDYLYLVKTDGYEKIIDGLISRYYGILSKEDKESNFGKKRIMVRILPGILAKSSLPDQENSGQLAIQNRNAFSGAVKNEIQYALRATGKKLKKKGYEVTAASKDDKGNFTNIADLKAVDHSHPGGDDTEEKPSGRFIATGRRNRSPSDNFGGQTEEKTNKITELMKKIIQDGKITAEEDEFRKELLTTPGLTKDVRDILSQQVKIVDDEFDYDAWLKQKDQEEMENKPFRRFGEWLRLKEIAGATYVVGVTAKKNDDYQIEGSPGISKRNKKNKN